MNIDSPQNPDVLFIVPPLFRFFDIDMQSYPLGLGYMVSYLKKAHIRSCIYNSDLIWSHRKDDSSSLIRALNKISSGMRSLLKSQNSPSEIAKRWPSYYSKVNNLENPVWQELRFVLENTRPRIVGISSRIVDIPSTLNIARIAKETLPQVKVVVGGASAASCSERLANNECIDFLVLGEGEQTMLELAAYLLDHPDRLSGLDHIQGLMFKGKEGLVRTPARPLINNLDDIPFPDREAVFVLDRQGHLRTVLNNADILTSRGCPYRCKFCCAFIAWGTRKFRLRSIENTVEELVHLKHRFGQREFIFWDDLFSVHRQRVLALCEKIIQMKLNIRWACLVRLNTIDAELLKVMKRAGCYQVQIGIESGNDRILKYIGKDITLAQVKEKVPMLRSSGLDWLVFLIIGFPTETEIEMKDTLRLVSEIKPTGVSLSIFAPYPGTEFYNELTRMGLLGADVMKSDTWYLHNNYTGTLSDEKFVAIAKRALEYVDRYNRLSGIRFLTLAKKFRSMCVKLKESRL